MSTGYSGKGWECPFFRSDRKQEVNCEGGCVKFANGKTFKAYTEGYCANLQGWRRCTLASALLQQYEEREKK